LALFVIGDLHLSIAGGKKMDIFDPIWIDHEKKLKENISALVKPEDTLVLNGDHTWGGHLSTCMPDLMWIINELPGHKVMLRGNHDIFWNAKKTNRLNRDFKGQLFFLQNNFYPYGDYALVGSKGYCYEPWDRDPNAKNRAAKRYEREVARVEKGFEAARESGYKKFILFLHYPPTEIASSENEYGGRYESCFTRLAKEYGTEQVIYSHLHGKDRFGDSLQGVHDGILYRLVSADFLNFVPVQLLP